MSHLLVKAIRVRVRNSPKVSLCATPDQFFGALGRQFSALAFFLPLSDQFALASVGASLSGRTTPP
jgi:hypothetical protein